MCQLEQGTEERRATPSQGAGEDLKDLFTLSVGSLGPVIILTDHGTLHALSS